MRPTAQGAPGADGDLAGKWVLRGQPALVESTCPRWGEKASYSSAVCLETEEVKHLEVRPKRPHRHEFARLTSSTYAR
jgi:hypothetical protein